MVYQFYHQINIESFIAIFISFCSAFRSGGKRVIYRRYAAPLNKKNFWKRCFFGYMRKFFKKLTIQYYELLNQIMINLIVKPIVTSTAKQVLGNCERMVFTNFIGNRVSTFILWIWLSTYVYILLLHFLYYAVKLFINLCCQALSYYSGCQPLHCTCTWNTVWKKNHFKLCYLKSNEWRVTDIFLAIDISETQYGTE